MPNGVPPALPALDDPSLYINRELSWMEFNRRVLHEALDSYEANLQVAKQSAEMLNTTISLMKDA